MSFTGLELDRVTCALMGGVAIVTAVTGYLASIPDRTTKSQSTDWQDPFPRNPKESPAYDLQDSMAEKELPSLQPATRAGTAPQEMLLYINTARRNRGLPPLVEDKGLSEVAEKWAKVMADQQTIAHHAEGSYDGHPHAFSVHYPGGWKVAGENVGMGRTVKLLFAAMYYGGQDAQGNCLPVDQGGGHCRNLMDPNYNHIGIGDVTRNGFHLHVQNFAQY